MAVLDLLPMPHFTGWPAALALEMLLALVSLLTN
jgi:hypothetical protein